MPWYMTGDARRDAEIRVVDGYGIQQFGDLWYVVNSQGSIRSQGYRTQTMAALKRDALERELRLQRQVFCREGQGHD